MFKWIKSLLVGALAGTALGVIFAPKKGEEIRKKFKEDFDKGGYGLNALKETATELGKEISENENFKKVIKKAKKYSHKAVEEVEDLYEEHVPATKRKKISNTVKKAKKTMKKTATKAKKAVNEIKKKK